MDFSPILGIGVRLGMSNIFFLSHRGFRKDGEAVLAILREHGSPTWFSTEKSGEDVWCTRGANFVLALLLCHSYTEFSNLGENHCARHFMF